MMLPCLLAGVFANPHNLIGSFSNFKAEGMKVEDHTVGVLYNSCQEFDQNGDLVSTGRSCIATLLWSTYQVLFAATQMRPVDIIQNGTVLDGKTSTMDGLSAIITSTAGEEAVGTAPGSPSSTASFTTTLSQSPSLATYGVKTKRKDDLTNSMLLKSINDGLPEQVGGKLGVRALAIGESELHPTDGIAIRTNIHGDNAVLHVHTNGSHATAEFKKEAGLQMTRRDQDVSMAHMFRFASEAFGIKMQVNKISRVNASMSDMHAYWNAFGYGNGEVDMTPAFNESDTWKFVVCEKDWGVIAGKVIALEGPSDYGYESADESIPC